MWKTQTRIAAIAIFVLCCYILYYFIFKNIPSFINRPQNYNFFLISTQINVFLPINRNN